MTSEALRPFRAPAMVRNADDPAPLGYLQDDADQAPGGLGIQLEVSFSTAQMRAEGHAPETVISSDAKYLCWTPAQMVAHHTSGGCNLQPGDLIGTDTISGPAQNQLSSLLELTEGGRLPFTLPTGEVRTFLEDGDMIDLVGWRRRDGFVPIGFGPCRGVIYPAVPGLGL